MSRTAAHFPDDSIMYMDEDLDSLVTWSDFLRDMALYFLGQRPNSDETGSQCNINDGGSLTFSSCGSLNVNDEQCNMHNSALEPNVSNRKPYPLRSQERYPDESAEEIVCDRFTMMDEINSEMDRCCCLHQSDEGHIPVWKQLHGTFDGVGSFPHPPTGLCTDSSHLRKSARNPRDGTSTAVCWADTGTRDCTNMCQSSPYKDSRQDPIPWEDVETRTSITGKRDMRVARATSRRSEILVRQTGISSSQTRAMSQLACSPGLVSN